MALKLTALVCLAAFEIGFIEAFRSDYTYIELTNSYYKHHATATEFWADAKLMCESEGAVLFHPDSEAELKAVKSALPGVSRMYTGLSDTAGKRGDYRTLDGRTVYQVFNKWYPGEPSEDTAHVYHCGVIKEDQQLYVRNCDFNEPYVCKHGPEVVKTTAEDEVKMIIANASSEIVALAANQTSALEILKQEVVATQLQSANQASTLEHFMANQTKAFEDLKRDIMAMKPNTVNHPSLLGRIMAGIANKATTSERFLTNQTEVLEQIGEPDGNHAAVLNRLMINQAAVLDRLTTNQAAALDMLTTNQAAALDRLTTNQAAALDRLTTSQVTALDRLTTSQAAALDSLTQVTQ